MAATLYDMQRVLEELNVRLGENPGTGGLEQGGNADAVSELRAGVEQLVTQMRAEQQVVREWIDEQSSQQAAVTEALRNLVFKLDRREG